jgi:hypothetical protein
LRATDPTSASSDVEATLDLSIRLAPGDSAIHHLLAVLHRKRAVIEMLSFHRGRQSHEVVVELRVRPGLEAHTVVAIQREVQVVSVSAIDRALG